MDSQEWFKQTFHRNRIQRRNRGHGRNKYSKGYRHHQTEPFTIEKDAADVFIQSAPPKNMIMANKLKEIGLIK